MTLDSLIVKLGQIVAEFGTRLIASIAIWIIGFCAR